MKKLVPLCIAAILLALLCACSGGAKNAAQNPPSAEPAASAEPTATPEPTPPPLHVAFVNMQSQSGALFFQGANAQAAKLGIATEAYVGNALTAPGMYDALVVYAGEGFDFAKFVSELPEPIPVVVYDASRAASPTSALPDSGRFSYVYYDGTRALELMYEAALAYPPHDTPVRLLGLFETEDGRASELFDQLYMEGMVLPKDAYYIGAENEPDMSETIKGMLQFYCEYEGLADGVIAESERLALEALSVLKPRAPHDFEIFCADVSEEIVRAMRENPEIFVAAVGENLANAGRECLVIAQSMANGTPPVTKAMQPCVVRADVLTDELLLTEALFAE